mmetsp:Transcript_18159/g.64351  ORF Transcript_18159/g.64351 Transcript_18159/m.64351 type:complete len:276 (+) Transcript_18159:603-1430(+)
MLPARALTAEHTPAAASSTTCVAIAATASQMAATSPPVCPTMPLTTACTRETMSSSVSSEVSAVPSEPPLSAAAVALPATSRPTVSTVTSSPATCTARLRAASAAVKAAEPAAIVTDATSSSRLSGFNSRVSDDGVDCGSGSARSATVLDCLDVNSNRAIDPSSKLGSAGRSGDIGSSPLRAGFDRRASTASDVMLWLRGRGSAGRSCDRSTSRSAGDDVRCDPAERPNVAPLGAPSSGAAVGDSEFACSAADEYDDDATDPPSAADSNAAPHSA